MALEPHDRRAADVSDDELDAAMAAAFAPTEQTGFCDAPGEIIGTYKLLQKIGEGGFGAVYIAEQKEPIRRRVALKVIKLGMDTTAVVNRFEAERQALAMMDHPNIAQVLDAGSTESGRPFFVMELVRGAPITEYCDRHRLRIRERLELFIAVCHAVQHAHQKGIIHRDLKPNNVLVALHDGAPVPKVIDFGIAKATQARLTEQSLSTQFGQFVGTPAYVSPEQADSSALDVDTRSDVFSLGVLLYELLTGSTPLDPSKLRTAGYAEMQRMIREEQPTRPSTHLAAAEQAETIAAQRGADLKKLVRFLSGEMDWIVLKALEKDRNRRYETANGLALDVRRFLDNEPVVAGPPSAVYRLRKFAHQHQKLLATAAAFAAILLLGAIVSSWQAVRAVRAQAKATAERNRVLFRFTDLATAAGAENSPYFREFATATFTDASATGDWERAALQLATAEELLGDRRPPWWPTNWWLFGPVKVDLETPGPAEQHLDPLAPVPAIDSDSPTNWIACTVHESGFMEISRVLIENGFSPGECEYVSTYAQMRVYSAEERLVAVKSYADDWVRLWLNGELLTTGKTKNAVVQIQLKAGWNTILGKVFNEQGKQTLRIAIADSPQEIVEAAIAQGRWDQADLYLAELEQDDARQALLLSARVRSKQAQQLVANGDEEQAAALLDAARQRYAELIARYPQDVNVARERELFTLVHDTPWRPLRLVEMKSAAGAVLTTLADGSILVSGVNPDRDTYTIVGEADLASIDRLRIDALPDASLYEGGGGRCPLSGNFHLSEVEVEAVAGDGDGEFEPVPLLRAAAEFSRELHDIANIVDTKPETYWDIWPRQTEAHSAYVYFDKSAAGPATAKLRIRLLFQDPKYSRHTLGRFRLFVSGPANEPRP